ncbi:MAG: hypothetical protein AAF824_19040 [Bacteroidota bacterium]
MIRYLSFFFLLAVVGCSDYDEVAFTVLLPDAGEDIIHFTDDSGTTINLDGSASSDVNNLGFTYSWEITTQPDGSSVALDGSSTATPSFTVAEGTSGRFIVSMTIARGDQKARDFINIDVDPQLAEVLLVNAIDAGQPATLRVPSIQLTSQPIAALEADITYHAIDLGLAADASGNVGIEIDYNGATISEELSLRALTNSVIYLTGSVSSPELLVTTKIYTNNSQPMGFSGLDAINLADVSDMVLFIDATAFNFGILPLDILFTSLGLPQTFGPLNFKQNAEVLFPTSSIVPLPIWATVSEERISNDSAIELNSSGDGQFGTFILFPDASSPLGHKLTFLNNSALLP